MFTVRQPRTSQSFQQFPMNSDNKQFEEGNCDGQSLFSTWTEDTDLGGGNIQRLPGG